MECVSQMLEITIEASNP